MFGQLPQEALLFLGVPIGLLHGAASVADRAERSAGGIGAQLMCLRIGMIEDLPRLEIEEFVVARVLKDERLPAVAHDHPIALANLQLGHLEPLDRKPILATA